MRRYRCGWFVCVMSVTCRVIRRDRRDWSLRPHTSDCGVLFLFSRSNRSSLSLSLCPYFFSTIAPFVFSSLLPPPAGSRITFCVFISTKLILLVFPSPLFALIIRFVNRFNRSSRRPFRVCIGQTHCVLQRSMCLYRICPVFIFSVDRLLSSLFCGRTQSVFARTIEQSLRTDCLRLSVYSPRRTSVVNKVAVFSQSTFPLQMPRLCSLSHSLKCFSG